MKYEELIEKIKRFEDEYWFAEYVYFKALEHLQDVRQDISRLKLKKHVKDIIHIFLSQWGQMARVVGKKDTEWDKLTDNLRRQKEAFQRLQHETLLSINFDDEEVAKHVRNLYKSAKVRNIGPTAISKILHLLNPGLFVMWDDEIRKKWKKKYPRINESADGYLEFLRAVQGEVKEAIEEELGRSRKSEQEIVEEICTTLPSKKLGSEYRTKTLAKLVDEYNWIDAHH